MNKHVARLQVGQDGGEVAGALDDRAGGGAKPDPEFAGDDLGERGLAETGRPVQQDMVQRLATGAGGRDEDGQVLARGALADELRQALRTQRGLRRVLLQARRGDGAIVVAHVGLRCASSLRLSRITASSPASSPRPSIAFVTAGCASALR